MNKNDFFKELDNLKERYIKKLDENRIIYQNIVEKIEERTNILFDFEINIDDIDNTFKRNRIVLSYKNNLNLIIKFNETNEIRTSDNFIYVSYDKFISNFDDLCTIIMKLDSIQYLNLKIKKEKKIISGLEI